MAELEELAKNVKAAREIIDNLEHILDQTARSVIVEVVNFTGRPLRRIPPQEGDGHSHGGYASLPAEVIAPYKSNAFASRSSGLATGTTGNIFYDLDGEGTQIHIRWIIPWIGSNEAALNIFGPNKDVFTAARIIGNGNTKVKARFTIGERADLIDPQPGWRYCAACKQLFFSDGQGLCPAHRQVVPRPDRPRLEFRPHDPAGYLFGLRPDAAGRNREGDWRKCMHCKSLFYDGFARRKGCCPKSSRGHVAEAGGANVFLAHDMAARATQQGDWRFCNKCGVLFFGPEGGECLKSGQHDPHPFNYVLDRL